MFLLIFEFELVYVESVITWIELYLGEMERKCVNGGPFWHLLREEVNQNGSVGASFKRGLKKKAEMDKA